MMMLLTKPTVNFDTLPTLRVPQHLGFREHCNYCVNNGFAPSLTPFGEMFDTARVTRFYGRTDTAKVPCGASSVVYSDHYTIAVSENNTFMMLYYHYGLGDIYCEVTHSPYVGVVKAMFRSYHAYCGHIKNYYRNFDMTPRVAHPG